LPNLPRLSAMYVGRIANPNEVLLLKRKRTQITRVPRKHPEDNEVNPIQTDEDGAIEPKIGDVINSYIERELLNELFVQDEEELNCALFDFVDKMDSHSFDKCVQKSTISASEVIDQTEVFNPADPDRVQSIREILTVQKKKKRDERPQKSNDLSLRILKSEQTENDGSPHIIEEEEVSSPHEEIFEEEVPSTPPPSRKRKMPEKETTTSSKAKENRNESESKSVSQPTKRLRQMKLEAVIESPSSSSSSSSSRSRPSLQIESVTPSIRTTNGNETPSQSQTTRVMTADPLLSVLTNSNSSGNVKENGGVNSNLTSKRILPQSLSKRPKLEEPSDVSILSIPQSQKNTSSSTPDVEVFIPPNPLVASQAESQKGDSQFQRSQQWGRRKTKT